MAVESTEKSYSNPPIIEVVFEIRFGADVPDPKLKKAHERIARRYADSKTERQVEVKIEVAAQAAGFTNKPPVFTLSSSDQTDQCVLSVRSIAWVRRSPYEGYVAFRDRLIEELALVTKAIGTVPIARIGLRYINRLDVPFENGLAYYERYLNFRIEHGDLLEPTEGYQWSLVKAFPDSNLKALVQSASVESEVPGYGAFVFDIDVSCEVEVPQRIDDITAKLETMRAVKNSIFEAGISDRAREAFT